MSSFKNDNFAKHRKKFDTRNVLNTSIRPVSGTIYYNDPKKSTTFTYSGDVHEILGDKSPLRFKEVKEYPIYIESKIESEESNTKEEEPKINNDLTVYLPSMLLEPTNLSIVILDSLPNMAMMLTGSTRTSLMNNSYFRCNLVPLVSIDSASEWDHIQKQTIERYTVSLFADDTFIFKDDDIKRVGMLDEILVYGINSYMETFGMKGTLALVSDRGVYIDNYLIEFINRKEVFSNVDMSKFFILNKEGFEESRLEFYYSRSLYEKIAKRKVLKDTDLLFHTEPIENFHTTPMVLAHMFKDESSIQSRIYDIKRGYLEEQQIDLKEDGDNILDRIILNYMDGSNVVRSSLIEGFLNYEIDETSLNDFIKYPVVVFILKQYILSFKDKSINSGI